MSADDLESISRRRYASAAAAVAETPQSMSHTPPVTAAVSLHQSYQVKAGVVLSRPPQITRDLTPFEKAYFFYQRRLNERLALPFTRYFYFKKGTPADLEWKRKQKERLTPARDIGVYNPYSREGWHDELLVGAEESDPEHQIDALLRDAEVPGIGSDELGEAKRERVERPMPRITEADSTGDERSLNRRLQRSLYLLVKGTEGRWTFPSASLMMKENLHQAAERILVQSGGLNMNTWAVGHVPVGYYGYAYQKPMSNQENGTEELGEKTFFMKARIMTGQASLTENKFGLVDFKWLDKDEIEKTVNPRYWSAVRNMLAER
ncbi:MAG: 54S ribosomal protein L17 mitochondrial [Pycnora praestabilis]|nr:MAG: 54S ribosomal protein L17 mitochondrial [Pycnora praestabilis]